jgi:hypothetical protein
VIYSTLLELPRKSETKKRKEDRRRKKNSLHERQARKLLVGCSTNREEDETLALQRNGEIIERGTKKKQQENGTERIDDQEKHSETVGVWGTSTYTHHGRR